MKNFQDFINEGTTPGEKLNDELRTELLEAFLQAFKGIGIKPEDVININPYNKYTIIKTKYHSYRINYSVEIVG